VGECSLIPGLSPEHPVRARRSLQQIASRGALDPQSVPDNQPAVRFAVETALIDLISPDENLGDHTLFDGPWWHGESALPINGLVWMDDIPSMLDQVDMLVERGFTTLKIKVGTLPFSAECELIQEVRRRCPTDQYTLRLDANGAFSRPETDSNLDARARLARLAECGIHSIEQPLRHGNWEAMRDLCADSPIPIALDEELIGLATADVRKGMLDLVKPQYLVLKPSLLGGFREANHWMDLASDRGIGWWATSALESNVGLSAIAQWTADAVRDHPEPLAQGLGTGGLFTNNVPSPLRVGAGTIERDPTAKWDFSCLETGPDT
jgi:o-succinylbenzoate synthase